MLPYLRQLLIFICRPDGCQPMLFDADAADIDVELRLLAASCFDFAAAFLFRLARYFDAEMAPLSLPLSAEIEVFFRFRHFISSLMLMHAASLSLTPVAATHVIDDTIASHTPTSISTPRRCCLI